MWVIYIVYVGAALLVLHQLAEFMRWLRDCWRELCFRRILDRSRYLTIR